jgi:hypothetical protein
VLGDPGNALPGDLPGRRYVAAVYLGTTAKFLAAHRFYEKNSFREIAREALPGCFTVMAVDTKFYTLAL